MSDEENPIDSIGYEYAYASQIAYIYEDEGYDKAEEELQKEFPNYKIDKELSDNYSITILKPDGQTILAYRGTDPTRLDDLMADAVILSGLYKTDILQYIQLPNGAYEYLPSGLTRFNLSQKKYEKVVEKHGDKITLTGHSKGGSLAHHVARINKKPSYVFNAGAVPNLYGEVYESDSNTYLVKGDLISNFATTYTPKEKVKFIPKTSSTAHSLQNFLVKPTAQRPPENIKLPKSLFLSDMKFTDPTIIETICKEYPELCPKGS
jgi:hypothetical protein